MSNTISPYALLCASKPKPAASLVTAYDLYSAAQNNSFYPSNEPIAVYQPQQAVQTTSCSSDPRAKNVIQNRTHYIADIKMRHALASRRMNR